MTNSSPIGVGWHLWPARSGEFEEVVIISVQRLFEDDSNWILEDDTPMMTEGV